MTSAGYMGAKAREARLPVRDGRIDFDDEEAVQNFLAFIGDAELPPVTDTVDDPYVGVTADGHPVPGLFDLADEGLDPKPLVIAAERYLDTLDADQRSQAGLAVDAREWRLWINAFLTYPAHGLLLDDLRDEQRDAAAAVVSASLSATGFHDIRTAMKLNAALGDLCPGYEDSLREWKYWFTLFGTPSVVEPWGWQLVGHHLDMHCFVVGGQMVLTPTFIGTEFDGHSLFADHIARATALMAELSGPQRDAAVLYPSMKSADLPHHLGGAIDGRHRAGAGRDNLVLPYEGIRGDALDAGQRDLLVRLTERYLASLPSGPSAAHVDRFRRHLDDTWFAWIGGWGDGDPFYYRIHSPVLLVEYDNHAGIFLDNPEPEPYHVHTIVRTPNGNDYGKDLLRQHLARDH